MLVVADSSPLIALINIGHINVLPRLFGNVVTPPDVFVELGRPNRPQAVQEFAACCPDWFREQAPTTLESIPSLHPGEIAAISLAKELKADLLLIDELLGRKAASVRGIPFTGTIGVLELAADKGWLDLSEAFRMLKNTDFWISPHLLDERLNIHLTKPRNRIDS